jgi:hypothetical protein
MGKTNEFDFSSRSPLSAREPADKRTREEVLRDVKLAIAQSSNYGSEARTQGSNPYDSRLGKPQRDIWSGRKRST